MHKENEVHIYTMAYYSAIHRNKMSFAGKWMELGMEQ
jgi:hypothetical protein